MKNFFTIAVFLFLAITSKAQNLTLTPGNQGKLNLPKLTYDQIQQIPSPESGSIVYDITTNCVRFSMVQNGFVLTKKIVILLQMLSMLGRFRKLILLIVFR